jgi:putative MATE family efflux protein
MTTAASTSAAGGTAHIAAPGAPDAAAAHTATDSAAANAISTRQHRLLHGPVLPVLSRLALPNVLAMVAISAIAIAETSYVGALGRDSLAAMAIVFPLVMLMQTLSGGAMGGGVSSAISRALGAGDVPGARALGRHAVAIGLFAGLSFTLLFALSRDALFLLLGARGGVLDEARRYGTIFCIGITPMWLANMLLSIIRGTGNMRVPSATVLCIASAQIALGASLALGWGVMPRLGMAGVAMGQLIAGVGGCAWLAVYLAAPSRHVRVGLDGWHLSAARFRQILQVGLVACLSPVQTVLCVLVMTALIARLGADALAGYGIGARLEFLAVPIAFGVGVATLPMVGLAVGSGNVPRARHVAWVGGAMAALATGAVGLVVAVWPAAWAGLFTGKAEVIHYASMYLRTAGPAFALFGLGLTLYFASQGAGRVVGPVLAGTLRLAVIIAGGWILTRMQAPDWAFFALVPAAMAAYGLATAFAVWRTHWGTR